MNFALVGCGRYGKNYIKAILQNGDDLKYICNKSKSPDSVPPNCQLVFGSSGLESILQDLSVETVIIATPPSTHYSLVKTCLESNKNVICEKPFVFSPVEAFELVALAEAKQLKLLVNYTRLFSSYVDKVDKIAAVSKKINLHLENGNWGPLRDYSSLWDYGSHEIAFYLRYFSDLDKISFRIEREEIGDFRNYCLNIDGNSESIVAKCYFGNAFFDKRRGLVIYSDGTPYHIDENPFDNPLANLISFFKKTDNSHPYFNAIPIKTTLILHNLENNLTN